MPSVCGVMCQHRPDLDAGDQPRLDGGAHRHAQVRVHLLVGWLAESLLQQPRNDRRPRAAADQHDLVHVAAGDAGVVQRPLHALHRAVQQRPDHRLVLLARHLHGQVQRLALLLRDELLLDARQRVERQLLLRLLHRLEQPRLRHHVLAQVDAVFRLEAVAQVVEQQLVEVVAAELRVAVTE